MLTQLKYNTGFVSFWYDTRILMNLHNETIFSLTMQTASYTTVFKEFAVM
jgi:hypothetical protein